jgi:probable addiction module antidote protein
MPTWKKLWKRTIQPLLPRPLVPSLAPMACHGDISKIAKKAGLSRESLYKALSTEGNPEFGTIIRVMQALGLKFSITAARAH